MTIVERGEVALYYESLGSGPAVTFAHGAGGNAASWFQQVPFFYNDYRTITFDHRAFARSRCRVEDFQVSEFAEDLRAILDDAGIERTALVCQSMGGWTGLNFALRYPERVSALVMSHTTGGITSDGIRAVMAETARSRAAPSSPFGSWAIAADLPAKDPVKANLYDQISKFNVTVNLDTIMKGLGGRMTGTDAAALAGFSVPTLFITAPYDVLMPPEAIELAAALVPGAEVHHVPGVGHSSYFEAPEQFNIAVAQFLSEHR